MSTPQRNTLLNYFIKTPTSDKSPKKKVDNSNLSLSTPTTKKSKKQVEKRQHENSDAEENVKPLKRKKLNSGSSDSETEDSKTNIKLTATPKKVKKNVSKPIKEEKVEIKKESFDTEDTWLHNKLSFLKPNKITDKERRPLSHPDYDPRTLYVPRDFLDAQTPAMAQWWMLKMNHFDCILFFKVGKFYELYHMDAVIGVNELGLTYMKGEFAHSGFPEIAYGRMANSLVELGYKVARVEQTELPENKKSKVISREICQITNKATQVQGPQDIEYKQFSSPYLLAILEKRNANDIEFGVCFIDTSIGIFHIGQFKDDERFSKLLTLLAQYPPAVILEERKQLSSEVKFMLKAVVNGTFEKLNSESQFFSSKKTLKIIMEYFPKNNDEPVMSDTIQTILNTDDLLNTTCKPDYELAVRCLGACIWYLKDCLLDVQLLSLCKYELYTPADNFSSTDCKFMVLDSCSLSSLNILDQESSLKSTLDHCCTPMGKRLLRDWICKPLCNIEEITARQNAINELLQNQEIFVEARQLLPTLPDLERLINRIHFMGNAKRAITHPDYKAILYEEKTYSKRKVLDFIQVLNGFEQAANLERILLSVETKLLKHLYLIYKKINLPEMIAKFKESFDTEQAVKDGQIIPKYGTFDEYDEAADEIARINEELKDYLKTQCTFFGCEVLYFGSDRKRFQLEVPQSYASKANSRYNLEGTRKGSKPALRYSTQETREFLLQMMQAENQMKSVIKDLTRKVFEKFSKNYDDLQRICYSIATLDVLLSLTEYAKSQSCEICTPEILPFSSSPQLYIQNGIHPFSSNIESFVPNDTELGTDAASSFLILTGPNMGGKSTLMRQVALLTIMAQIGCLVPATKMKLTLVDRIFTRIGAHDDIMAGNSTFLVELREALAILQRSTVNSLVFLDELGRGTSTYDGTAIATAYVDSLLKINCRAIFSTHYYTLIDYFKNNNSIQFGHMACKVESEEDAVSQETVIFMYKIKEGPCPKSYGFNAARLAGIPNVITQRAHQISQQMEAETQARKIFRMIFTADQNLSKILNSI